MPRIPRARHESYDYAGRPVVRVLDDVTCADSLPDFLGLRHVGYTAGGYPVEAYAWVCCDAFCTPAELNSADCYKQPLLWPLGPGPGITKRVAVYVFDVSSCLSAVGARAVLTYDAGDGKWHGSVSFRGGTLNLVFEVTAAPTGDPAKFTLTYSGCGSSPNWDSGTLTAGYSCSDPLYINFGQANFPFCCTCPGSGSTTTDTPAALNFYVAANCRAPRLGRHVHYGRDGSPQVVVPRSCPWDLTDPVGCAVMTCPVVFSVTNVSDCACLAGDWPASYTGGAWEALAVGGCVGTASIDMTCSDAGEDAQHRSLVTLAVNVVCGAATTGSGSVTLLAADLDDLDETVTIDLVTPTAPTCTDCTWQWSDMLAAWTLLSGCTGDVGCGSCPETPASPPGSPSDGDTWSETCPGVTASECCTGRITVRCTRA